MRASISRFQPSTRTKSISLKGRAMVDGGSITIPIDIRVDETIISIIRFRVNILG